MNRKHQSGLTLISFLVVLGVVGFAAFIGMKLLPMYQEYYSVRSSMKGLESEPGVRVIQMPHANGVIAPIVYTVPLQLLAYHAAVLKGTDIDQPRNLAKSVTVE